MTPDPKKPFVKTGSHTPGPPPETTCTMVVGWKVAGDGESPGNEITCTQKATYRLDDYFCCESCYQSMAEDPEVQAEWSPL